MPSKLKLKNKLRSFKFKNLESKNKEARLNQNSKNSHKPPSSDIFKKERDRKTSRRKSGGQAGHEGSNLKMVSIPTDTKEYPAPENCEKCNQSLLEIQGKSKVGQEYTLPKMEISIIEHRVESKKCICGRTNTSSKAPVIKNHAYYGNEFKSFIIYLKNHHMLPFGRIKELIKDVFSHTVSEGTIWISGTAVHDFFKPYLKFECEHSFCNAHLIQELIGAHETTQQVWTEMMLGVLITGLDARKEAISEPVSLDILKMYDKSILMGYQENTDIDIGKRKSSSKAVNLLRRMDRHKEDILKFLFTTDVPFDNNLAKEGTEDV